MIGITGFRSLLESVDGNHRTFGRRLSHLMGVTDSEGRHHVGRDGGRVLRDPTDAAGKVVPRIDINEMWMPALLESTLGPNAGAQMGKVRAYLTMRALFESENPSDEPRNLFEDTGAGAQSAATFANINAFTGVVAGLLDAAILKPYQNPKFIGDRLAPVQPSKQFEGRKDIGVSRLGDVAEERLPLMPTKRVGGTERWMTQPRTVENAAACEISQEAMFLDLTGGQLMDHCGAPGVGKAVGLRKEYRIIDSFIGVTNSYNYKGNSYTTYLSTGFYTNLITGNEIIHEDQIQNIMILFRDMLDPDISLRVLVEPNCILVNREKKRTVSAILGPTAKGYQYRDAPGATATAQEINVSDPFYKGDFEILESPFVFQRMTDASGLNLSASNAAKVTHVFESGLDTHVYVQNWPLRIQTAAPNQVDMIDRGVVMFAKADERGVPWWIDPRRAVKSTS